MTRRVTFLDSSRYELRTIFSWIARQSASVKPAQMVLDDIEAKISDIANLPFKIGTPVEELARSDLYKIVHKRFVLYVRYPDDETLEIFTILWGGRDAGRYFESLVTDVKK